MVGDRVCVGTGKVQWLGTECVWGPARFSGWLTVVG